MLPSVWSGSRRIALVLRVVSCLLKVGLSAVWKFHLEVGWLVGLVVSRSWGLLDVAGVLGRLETGLATHEEEDDLDQHDKEVSDEANDHPEPDGFVLVVSIRGITEHQKYDEMDDQAEHFFDDNQNSADVHEGLEAHNGEDDHEQINDPVDAPASSWFSETSKGEDHHDDVSDNPNEVIPLGDWCLGKDSLLLMHVTEVVAHSLSGAVFSESDGF